MSQFPRVEGSTMTTYLGSASRILRCRRRKKMNGAQLCLEQFEPNRNTDDEIWKSNFLWRIASIRRNRKKK